MNSKQTKQKTPERAASRGSIHRNSRLRRLLQLAHIVKTEGTQTRLNKFLRDYGIAKRTLYRDLQVLRSAGLNISYSPATHGYRISDSVDFPFESMKTDDLGILLAVLKDCCLSEGPTRPFAQESLDRLNAFVLLLDDGVQKEIIESTNNALIQIHSGKVDKTRSSTDS